MLPCADFSKQSVSLGCPSCFRRAPTSVACCPTISDHNFNHNMGPKSLTSQLHEPSDTLHRPLDGNTISSQVAVRGAWLPSRICTTRAPATNDNGSSPTTRFEAALMTSRPTFGPMNLQTRPNETIFEQVGDMPSVRATRRSNCYASASLKLQGTKRGFVETFDYSIKRRPTVLGVSCFYGHSPTRLSHHVSGVTLIYSHELSAPLVEAGISRRLSGCQFDHTNLRSL